MKTRIMAAAVMVLALTGCAVSPPGGTPTPTVSAKPLVVASGSTATERLLAEIYTQVLTAKGFKVTTVAAPTDRFVTLIALRDASISVVPAFAATWIVSLDPATEAGTADQFIAELQDKATDKVRIVKGGGLRDDLVYVVTKATSTAKSVKSLTNLTSLASTMTLIGPSNLDSVPDGIPSLTAIYRLVFKAVTKEDSAAARVAALTAGTADVAVLSRTEPAVADLVTLTDPQGVILPNPEVALVSADVTGAGLSAIQALQAALTTVDVVTMNKAVVAGTPLKDVVATWLRSRNLA